ncbi:MAG: hypothetical protein MUF62_08585 [Chitinophagaceae bacterium]|nr:hypothetical protein [Chitinophagaceae bacterium]
MYNRFYLLLLAVSGCSICFSQDSAWSWRHKINLDFTFANGRNSFPAQDVMLGDALSIRLSNLGLARQHLFEFGGSFRTPKLPIEPYLSIGYWHFEQAAQYTNFMSRQDRIDFFPNSTFLTIGWILTQRRLSANFGTRLHVTDWLYLRGGMSFVATIASVDWDGGLSTWAAMDLYRPVFELHKYWQPTHWFGTYGIGLQRWGVFVEYYRQHSLSDFVSQLRFRNTDYQANFGRNTNAGIALGYRASLAQIQSFFSGKASPRLKMATVF